MLSRRSTELNHVLFPDVRENGLNSGEQAMFISVVVWLNPFTLSIFAKEFRRY